MITKDFQLATAKQSAEQLGCSTHWLKKLRLDGKLQEGIHWVRIGKRSVRYVTPLLVDYFRNRHQPYVHQQFIEDYVASWDANQPRKPGRKSRHLSPPPR
jgi:hypothetical protein